MDDHLRGLWSLLRKRRLCQCRDYAESPAGRRPAGLPLSRPHHDRHGGWTRDPWQASSSGPTRSVSSRRAVGTIRSLRVVRTAPAYALEWLRDRRRSSRVLSLSKPGLPPCLRPNPCQAGRPGRWGRTRAAGACRRRSCSPPSPARRPDSRRRSAPARCGR